MTTKDNVKPLLRRTFTRSMKARSARRDNLAQITKSMFVAGGKEVPTVKTRIIPVECVIEGRKSLHYEVRIEVDKVRLGERASPLPMRGEAIRERISQERLHDYDELLTAFVPDHLAVDPRPHRLLKAF